MDDDEQKIYEKLTQLNEVTKTCQDAKEHSQQQAVKSMANSRLKRTRRTISRRKNFINTLQQSEKRIKRLHEDKSMLKHIMRECKVVNYVDKETSSGTQISSRRRSSRITPARLHKACTVERRNTNLEELTKTFPERDEEQWNDEYTALVKFGNVASEQVK